MTTQIAVSKIREVLEMAERHGDEHVPLGLLLIEFEKPQPTDRPSDEEVIRLQQLANEAEEAYDRGEIKASVPCESCGALVLN